jgi:hypothetical protein
MYAFLCDLFTLFQNKCILRVSVNIFLKKPWAINSVVILHAEQKIAQSYGFDRFGFFFVWA